MGYNWPRSTVTQGGAEMVSPIKPHSITLLNELHTAINRREKMCVIMRLYASYVLASHAWNKTRAADALEVDRRTLRKWETEILNTCFV